MKISLHKAEMKDCVEIREMQRASFQSLLNKYQDAATNPGAESLEEIERKMAHEFTDYYFISLGNEHIGVIRVVRLKDHVCRISPMFILPEYQGNGYAQQTITEVESVYPQTCRWELDTIKQEPKLCHLYEKMGYQATGKETMLQRDMTIIFYEKSMISEKGWDTTASDP